MHRIRIGDGAMDGDILTMDGDILIMDGVLEVVVSAVVAMVMADVALEAVVVAVAAAAAVVVAILGTVTPRSPWRPRPDAIASLDAVDPAGITDERASQGNSLALTPGQRPSLCAKLCLKPAPLL